MMTRRSALIWWIGLLSVASGLASAAQSAPPAPTQGGPAAGRDTVVIGALREPDTLNPLFQDTMAATAVIATLFTKDVQIDAEWRFSPQGMEYLPTIADGTWVVDGESMILTWKLKRRFWHDGRPVTCSDYVFTLAVARDHRVPVNPMTRFYTSRIASITCPRGAGGAEIVVVWKQRDALANLYPMAAGHPVLLPRHALESFYRANPARLGDSPYGFDPAGAIGDGPYRLVEWQRGVSLTVEAVGNHPVFGTPSVRRIIWRFFSSSETLSLALLAGTIDVVSSAPAIPFDTALQLAGQAGGRFRVAFETGGLVEYMVFNLDNPLLRDVRVRWAIAYGINRTQISQQLFQGKQPVAHSYLPRKHPGYTAEVKTYPHDPSRAKALLREAGFSPGTDGILRTSAGLRLSLELNTTAGNRDRERTERLIQEQLKQVGIEIRIANFPVHVLFGEVLAKRKFEALIVFASFIGPGTGCEALFTSTSIPAASNSWNGGNYSAYRNAAMDRVCEEAVGEVDPARRNALYRESTRIVSRDLPLLPLYYRVTIAAVKSGIRNFSLPGLPNDTETWNAHSWSWD